MATYGKQASDKIQKTMHERKHATLKSGSGHKVTSRKQAIAIGLSEARKAGGNVPAQKSSADASANALSRSASSSRAGKKD